MKMTPQPGPDAHDPEVTGSNPVPATTKALARGPFGEVTKGSWSYLAAIRQQTYRPIPEHLDLQCGNVGVPLERRHRQFVVIPAVRRRTAFLLYV
jgi:hypothetical protein